MIKKQRFIICVLLIITVVAALSVLAACDTVIYDPEKAEKPPTVENSIPLPLEYNLYVQAYGARPVGFPIGSAAPEYYVFSEGATISGALNYVKEGFDFAGWYTDENFANSLASFVMPSRDLYVYAKWVESEPVTPPVIEPGTVTISFEVMTAKGIGEEARVTPLTGKEGEKIKSATLTALPAPTYPGYNFAGWYSDEGLNAPYILTDDSVFELDTTLYAKWERQYYTVTFDTAGGNNISPMKLTSGSSVSAPESPIKIGSNFVGWFMVVNDGNTIPVDFTNLFITDKNLEIYAVWEAKSFTLSFDAATAGAAYESVTVKYGENITAYNYQPTKFGYNFIGWYENKYIESGDVPFDFSAMPPYDMTLYAQWSYKDHELAVTIANGDVKGSLYPEGDAAWEPVYAILKAKASAVTEHTNFKSLSFVISISELNVTLGDGTVETYANANDIAKLLTFTCGTDTLLNNIETDIRLDFILNKNADKKYAGAKFDIKIKLYTGGIVDEYGNDVDADEIKTVVEIA